MLPASIFALLAVLLQPTHAQHAPLLGDTSSSLAILFSPPFLPPTITSPTYPNYTLPSISPSFSPPSNPPNFTLVLFPTTNNSPKSSNGTSAQALRAVTGAVLNTNDGPDTSLVLRDLREGWRTQWVVGNLQSQTNYTAFTINEGNQTVAGPVFMLTKSSSFPCTLTHSISYCPFVAYAVPLPAPSYSPMPSTLTSTNQTQTEYTLPSNVSANLLSSLINFSVSLSSFACGRDVYSPLKTCADCYEAYRDWACAISLPRCAERDPSPPPPLPPPALTPRSNATTRNDFPGLGQNYTELLPCIETCTAVDRSCPYFLQFRCPVQGVTAQFSYGVGFIDGALDGSQGAGVPGVADDDGWVFCNAATSYDA